MSRTGSNWKDAHGADGLNIATKELIPIVMAVALWGRNREGQVVQCRCDNSAVVAVLTSRTSRDQDLMHLLRCLALFEAKLSVRVVGTHLPGIHNTLADNLSRDALSSFLQASPLIISNQSVPPPPLLKMLISHKPDWTSPAWREMCNAILNWA